jgi:hypothetical protein
LIQNMISLDSEGSTSAPCLHQKWVPSNMRFQKWQYSAVWPELGRFADHRQNSATYALPPHRKITPCPWLSPNRATRYLWPIYVGPCSQNPSSSAPVSAPPQSKISSSLKIPPVHLNWSAAQWRKFVVPIFGVK